MENWLKTGRLSQQTSISKTVADDEGAAKSSKNIDCSDAENAASSSTRHYQENQAKLHSKKRRYDDSYLSFGFIPVGSSEEPDALCLVCKKILVNSSLAPAKLKRHFDTIHENLKEKNISYFQKEKEMYESVVSNLTTYAKTDNENATEASFILSYRIARSGKPHTVAETLIKPCMIDTVRCVLGEAAAKKVAAVQCSNNTVSDRIHKISDHIEDELVRRLNVCDMFAMQLDESTDIAGLSILLVFVRYPFDKSIQEDLLICTPLETNTTGEEIFKVINCFMSKHNINWGKCIDICSDGAAAMVGKVKGVVSKIKNIAPRSTSSHCILHRYALVMRRMPTDLKKVLDEAVKIVNFVKSRPLQSRLFKLVCKDMGSQYESLFLHTEIRWLSRGKALSRLFQLRNELNVFQLEKNMSSTANLFDALHDEQWITKLAYLADIFEKINETATTLQGKSITVFFARDKLESLKRKINFWLSCVQENNVECFPVLHEFLQENLLELKADIRNVIAFHLVSLERSMLDYFPDTNTDIEWVQNPFLMKTTKPMTLSIQEYEYLIDLQSSSSSKFVFDSVSLHEFWIAVKNEYPALAKKAILNLLPFVTTYRCEAGFSAYTYTKTKYRSRLDAAPDMRIQLSDIEVNFKTIINKTMKQIHSSH
ncbi:zinc finger BED domain-containing protein 5-like [Eupeodes corollae]|uniref:zinc finger BED domain-containing protein 5-like n=1 Tax=Eupeodes corollae TaxID=290404 RepID=UPI002491A64A|nr:zinc finger BED domain-containing protein 5-like [Eupeodes corollae]